MGKAHEIKKVFVDTDILLDFIMERKPFHIAACGLIELAKREEINLYASSVCFTNIFYIFKKIAGSRKAKQAISSVLMYLEILNVDALIIQSALNSDITDFEDAVQYYTAIQHSMEIILTRNVSDFKKDEIPVLTAEEFIKTI